ncbi:MAG: tetratricopeptide (TPR) repeat protein [Polaribacter sp.]|jgi:tetratricopeptide (TPR) repeat protein
MTFKKTTLFTAALLISVAVFGQKSKRTSANNYLEYGELDNAKEAIDPTILHEKTMNEAKTWYFRGLIYQAIYETKDEKYKTLDDNPLQVAYESFAKCVELDEKKYHTDMVLKYLDIEGKQFVNQGILAYNAKEYAKALKAFENTLAICKIENIERTDTLAIYYAGACAQETGDLAKSEMYYRQAIAVGYKAEAAYVRMERMYAAAENNEKAFAILKEGREKFPENQTMITDEVNVYLGQDKHAEAVTALSAAIKGEPDNASLHFAFGFVNDRLASKELEKDDNGGEQYDLYMIAAENSYKKAMELDPTNFDAVYNLGAMYFNRAVKMNEAANMIDDMKKFEIARDAADVEFDISLPILEQAYQINADDKGVLASLKQLYYRKMAKDESYKTKYDEIVAKLK